MPKKIFLLFLSLIFLTLNLATCPCARAQAYRSQLHFLEEFALLQYNRGDMANASKEFQRILRIQPDNAIAREYLKKIADQPETSSETRANIVEVISDISHIKDQLLEYEKDTKDLEYMIRNLITENDALYQSLYKRSREVLELREKFYGTPYSEIYTSVMKDIPIDRVPQRLHPSNDILTEETPAYAKGSFAIAINTSDVNALIADIALLAKQHKPLTTPINGSPELYNALDAKRGTLLDTTLATNDKHQNLERIKNELTSMNTNLKQGVDRYIEAINKIDHYYKTIKDEIAAKNFKEQRLFSELVADYADRVKEIEELKRTIPNRDAGLTSFKSTLASDNTKITDLKKVMNIRDQQLSDMKTLLVRYKKQLSERDMLISQQQGDLKLTDKNLTRISREISRIENGLLENDTALNDLNSHLTPATPLPKPAAPLPKPAAPAMKTTTAYNMVQAKKVAAQNAALEARLDVEEKALGKSGMRIKNLERQLATVTTDLNKALVTQETVIEKPLLNKIKTLESSLAQQNDNAAKLQKKLDQIPQEFKQLREESAQLKQELAASKTQNQENLQNLAEAATKTSDLQRELAAKQQRLEELSGSIVQLQDNQRNLHPVSGRRAVDDDAVRTLEMRLRRSQDLLSEAESNASQATRIAAELNEKIAARDVQIEQLQQLTSINQSDELKSVKRQLTDQDATISELRQQNSALKAELESPAAVLPVTASVADPKETLEHEQKIKALEHAAKELLAQKNTAVNAQAKMVNQLKEHETSLAVLEKKVNNLRQDITEASSLIARKTKENDTALREIKRLNDIIEKKNNEIMALQLRVK
ncbi:MAG: hypothetical protein V2A70_10765 [Candidatus Omnitrophota bacterium]